MKDWTKLTVKMWSQIVQKVAVIGIGLLWKNIAKKCKKTENFHHYLADSEAHTSHPIKFLRPCFDGQFFQSFIVLLTTRPSAVRKYL